MDHGCGGGAVLSQIHTVAETGSTNTDLVALARAGAAEGFWLIADRQRDGRGRQGRTWASPPGNFAGSTLVRLRPTDPAAATLALVAAVAVEDAVSLLLLAGGVTLFGDGTDARGGLALKWPNDLMLGGAKLAGILLERIDDAVVVGIGVNLAHHPDLPDRPTTSLAAHGVSLAPQSFAEVLVEAFARWLARWRGEGIAAIRARWLDRAHPVGTALTVRLPDGSATDGLFDGLDPDGALMLRLASGERRAIHAADVFLI